MITLGLLFLFIGIMVLLSVTGGWNKDSDEEEEEEESGDNYFTSYKLYSRREKRKVLRRKYRSFKMLL